MTFIYLLISFFLFYGELTVMEAIYFIRYRRREKLWLRIPAAVAFCILLGVLLTIPFYYSQGSNIFYIVGSAYFTLILAATIACIYFCFKTSIKKAIYCGTAAYALQHIVSCFSTTIFSVFLTDATLSQYSKYITLLLTVIVAIPAYFIFGKNIPDDESFIDERVLTIAVTIIISGIILSMCKGKLDSKTTIIVNLYDIIACMYTLISLTTLLKRNKVQYDNDVMEQLLSQERRQQELNKRNIEIINLKCHDLKHQINMLQNMNDNQCSSTINELSQAIMIYDSNVKSGNDTLDLIISEKKLLFSQYNIKFSSILNGSAISFMDIPDICSLFGNLLENAFESVLKENDEEKRVITLNISYHVNTVVIHMSNHCTNPPEFSDGLPLSDKGDYINHGYGMKSIQYIVKRYKGNLNIYYKDNKFITDILFIMAK